MGNTPPREPFQGPNGPSYPPPPPPPPAMPGSQWPTHSDYGFVVPPPPRRKRWPWVAAGCAIAAVCVGITTVIVGGGSGSPHNTAAPSPSPSPAVTTAGKVFSHVADGCTLVKPPTIAAYVPGAICIPMPSSLPSLAGVPAMPAGVILKVSSWGNIGPQRTGGLVGNITATVMVTASAQYQYAAMKKGALLHGAAVTVTDSRPLTGLGDEAYVVYGTEPHMGAVWLVSRWGNASIEVIYTASTTLGGQAVPQHPAEEAAVAAAHDVYSSLS